eukprot:Opistho-2@69580
MHTRAPHPRAESNHNRIPRNGVRMNSTHRTLHCCANVSGMCLLLGIVVAAMAIPSVSADAIVFGYTPLTAPTVYDSDGVAFLTDDGKIEFVVFGNGFTNRTDITFTSSAIKCETSAGIVRLFQNGDSVDSNAASISVTLPFGVFYMCVDGSDHMGSSPLVTIRSVEKTLSVEERIPLAAKIVLILFLLCLSGLFSGLNLGLMGLDTTGLKVIMETGTPEERGYAKAILPVRQKGNYLLCTLLLGNVLVNNTLAVLLESITSGVIAVLGSTAAIVVLGEIIPQSACSRKPLAVGAKTIWITKMFMLLTFPMAWPISKGLDYFLGEEIGTVYQRAQLKQLLKITAKDIDLDNKEVAMVSGALEFSLKKVGEVMTKLENVFMIELSTKLDYKSMSRIVNSGHSRVPVFDKDRANIVGILYLRDLTFLDPNDGTPLKAIVKMKNRPVHKVFDDTRLDKMLDEFKKGKSHISIVQRVNDDGPGDPFYENVGIVTLEDVLEELLQAEILDETDVQEEVLKSPRSSHVFDSKAFAKFSQKVTLTPQMQAAVLSYLPSAVKPFADEFISQSVLKRLVERADIEEFHPGDEDIKPNTLYTAYVASDFFTLVLSGKVQLKIGRESFIFDSGPFTCLGVEALAGQYIPDYTAVAAGDTQVLRIPRSTYAAAVSASSLERTGISTPDNALTFSPVLSRELSRASFLSLPAPASASSGSVDVGVGVGAGPSSSDVAPPPQPNHNPFLGLGGDAPVAFRGWDSSDVASSSAAESLSNNFYSDGGYSHDDVAIELRETERTRLIGSDS